MTMKRNLKVLHRIGEHAILVHNIKSTPAFNRSFFPMSIRVSHFPFSGPVVTSGPEVWDALQEWFSPDWKPRPYSCSGASRTIPARRGKSLKPRVRGESKTKKKRTTDEGKSDENIPKVSEEYQDRSMRSEARQSGRTLIERGTGLKNPEGEYGVGGIRWE